LTDIKPDNIMIQLPDESIIRNRYLAGQDQEDNDPGTDDQGNALEFLSRPINMIDLYHREHKIDPDWTQLPPYVVPSNGLKDWWSAPEDTTEENFLHLKIALCDWGVASWEHNHLTEHISPPLLRSPELLIGAPWNSKSDIWALGCVIVELMQNYHLFSGYAPELDNYNDILHLNEMCQLFGSFPKSFLEKGDKWFVKGVFDGEGRVWGVETQSDPKIFWEGAWNSLDEGEEDRENFFRMLRNMMKIDPQERKSAAELLEEPWLKDVEL
jgi:serine/threonine-protein kinase SRPK3